MRLRIIATLLLTLGTYCAAAASLDATAIDSVLAARDIDLKTLQTQGPSVMPVLATLYSQSKDKAKRARIAWVFYQLGMKSEAAKNAMLEDIHSEDRDLRLQVQWALGRVSSDDRIVEVLLENMRDDRNPLFREKAACALASDQIHLTPKQHSKLLSGLIAALGDAKLDVRQNAIQALVIQTGQSKGFNPAASELERKSKMLEWQRWLSEYDANL